MNFLDFIKLDELDDLPDDPASAFVHLVRIAQQRLGAVLAEESDNGQNYEIIQDARYGFMNVTIALGKKYDIQPFAEMEVPRVENFDRATHRQFQADLDHYMTQLLVGRAIENKRDSVVLAPKVKDSIRQYVYAIKNAIDAAKLDESRKEALRKRLAEFETELDKPRLNLLAVARAALAVAMIPGGLWSSAEAVGALTERIWTAVAEAKSAEIETNKLPAPAEKPLALLPPRPPAERRTPKPKTPSVEELDDEIPF